MRLRRLLPLLALLVALPAKPTLAQSGPTVTRNEIGVDFPQSATFSVASDVPLAAATITYRLPQVSCVDFESVVPVTPEGAGAEWTWIMNRSGNLPSGATVEWTWTVTDENGATTTTPLQSYTFIDDRFNWQTIARDRVTLSWYEGDDVGPLLHDAAVASLARLEEEMGIELQQDVSLFIYGTSSDLRDALVYAQEWTGGIAFSQYNVILLGVEPEIAVSWGVGAVSHELAHLVVGQFGRSCVGGSRPTWLNEGLAMYAEGEPDGVIRADLRAGIEEDQFFPLRSLGGAFPAHGSGASMAYSQSYSIVDYMLRVHGQAAMQALLLEIAAGETADVALQTVYGVDSDGLEKAWRAAIGAAPRTPPPTPTPVTAAAVPTVVPIQVADVATPPAAAATAAPQAELAQGEERGGAGSCLPGIGAPLLLVGLLLMGVRRRRYGA
jgi:hypothetical protein